MAKYLILTENDQEYNQNENLILVQEKAIPYLLKNELIKKGKHVEALPEITFGPQEVSVKTKYLEGVYKYVMERLTSYLNRLHGEEHDQKFWEIAFGIFVPNLIYDFYDVYLELKQADELCHDAISSLEVDENADVYGWRNFLLEEPDANYFCTIAADILDVIDVSFQVNVKRTARTAPHSLEHLQRDAIWTPKELSRRMDSKTEVVLCTPYLSNEALDRIISASNGRVKLWSGRGRDIVYSVLEKCIDTDYKERRALNYEKTDDEFINVILNSIVNHLPVPYCEGYKIMREQVEPLVSSCNAKVVASANSYVYSHPYDLWSAMMYEKGAKVCAMQHGGNVEFRFESMIFDRVYLWGTATAGSKTHSGVAGKLIGRSISQKPPIERKELLFISTGFNRFRNEYLWPLSFSVEKQIKNKISFIEKISKSEEYTIKVREYMKDYGRDRVANHLDTLRNVQMQNSRLVPLDSALEECSLCVIDNYQTVILEAIYLDVPTIFVCGILDNVPLFEELRDLLRRFELEGLYFRDTDQAADYVNSIKDPRAWWNEPGRKALIDEFKHKYAYVPDDWAEQYVDMLYDWEND